MNEPLVGWFTSQCKKKMLINTIPYRTEDDDDVMIEYRIQRERERDVTFSHTILFLISTYFSIWINNP